MDPSKVQIEEGWKSVLLNEFEQDYFDGIKSHLLQCRQDYKVVYPPGRLIFNAFNLTPWNDLKVVILGQDPYHGPGEAMGLCFSVPESVKIPPSLVNIYKELHSDIGTTMPTHGNLTSWASQGVFLLNSMLTVEHKSPGSHRKIGWQRFTDAVIKTISDRKENVVFLLWGKFAQSKIELIDQMRHYVLTAAHPSPLARNAFSGCRHFSKTNDILKRLGKQEIDWQV